MEIFKYIKRSALLIVNLCVLVIVRSIMIDLSYEIIWWVGVIALIVWYGCACWEGVFPWKN